MGECMFALASCPSERTFGVREESLRSSKMVGIPRYARNDNLGGTGQMVGRKELRFYA